MLDSYHWNEHPAVVASIRRAFYLERGWKRQPFLRRRATLQELRRLHREGATHVLLDIAGEQEDVAISDLLGGKVGIH